MRSTSSCRNWSWRKPISSLCSNCSKSVCFSTCTTAQEAASAFSRIFAHFRAFSQFLRKNTFQKKGAFSRFFAHFRAFSRFFATLARFFLLRLFRICFHIILAELRSDPVCRLRFDFDVCRQVQKHTEFKQFGYRLRECSLQDRFLQDEVDLIFRNSSL